KMSYTKVLFGVLVVYVLHTCWALYGFVHTKACDSAKGDDCVTSYLSAKPRLQLSVYSTLDPSDESAHTLLLKVDKFEVHTKLERQVMKVNVVLSALNPKNGTLHAVVFVHKSGVSPWKDSKYVRIVARLTFQMSSAPPMIITGSAAQPQKGTEMQNVMSYWKSHITLNMMTEDFTFNNAAVPSDLRRYIKIVEDVKKDKKKIYLPLLLIDEMRSRLKDLIVCKMNASSTQNVPLTISYETITLRKFRMWIHIQGVIYSLKHFGFSEERLDEIKGMFVETGLHILLLSILVPAFHLSFEVFAMKNDVSFWRGKKSLAGISRRSVIWRCFSTVVIFFYMVEEQTSWLTLIPMGCLALIELWKVSRVFALWSRFKDGRADDIERATEEHDSRAMKFLLYLMYPLCISGAVYSFIYLRNKSTWYFWIMNSLISGVYAVGFLSMVPQLFVNYKMKSVAQLPMSVLLYKGLNTFISDIFSGVLSTPGPHPLACFRDDVIFLIYLYQR
ncbi:cleft lip and palate transmembrane protein 1-like protein, partial [Silurus meridionalis]